MPGFKYGNPGCECCDEGCERYSQTFDTDGGIVGFTVTSGAASQASGWGVLDPSTTMYCNTGASRTRHEIKANFRLDADDVYIEYRIGWDRTAGKYYFARFYSSTASLDAGKIELGIYDGGETILQGPFYVYTLDKDKTHYGTLCIDGFVLSCAVVTEDNIQQRLNAKEVGDFTATDGEDVGFATDSGGTEYKIDNFILTKREEDIYDESELEEYCWLCSGCQFRDTEAKDMDHDEWEVVSGSYVLTNEFWPYTIGLSQGYYSAFEFGGAALILRRDNIVTGTLAFRFSMRWILNDLDQGNSNEVHIVFWWEDANNYWYVNFKHDEWIEVYQVVAGSGTMIGRTTQYTYDDTGLDPYFRDEDLVAAEDMQCFLELTETGLYMAVGGIQFGIVDLTPPAQYRVGFKVVSASGGNPVGLINFYHSCGVSLLSECTQYCTSGFLSNSYQIELVGAECPFHTLNGTYITNQSENCESEIVTYVSGKDGATESSALFSISSVINHPSTGVPGVLVVVNICQRTWDPSQPVIPNTTEQRETSISEYCNGVGTGASGVQNQGSTRSLCFGFRRWIDQANLPFDCEDIDWYMYLDDVISQTPTLAVAYPGVDFSNVKLRIRSLPL